MKKTIISSIAILSFIAFAFSQPVSPSADVTKSAQITNLNKKTSIQPKPPTNWSRFKDLFK
jgi:hypothetical protein